VAVLFAPRFRSGIADGSITLTFRRWKRAQVIAGRRYRTPVGMLEVETIDVVDADDISDQEAGRAGFASADAVRDALRGDPGDPVYRIRFHAVTEPDPRDVLAHDDALGDEDIVEIDRRLDRLDGASSHGAWTAATLAVIAERPGVRAADLAASLGRERAPFKLDVRKLKALGLTLSLDVGYKLSPRGQAYWVASTVRGRSPRARAGARSAPP
jgi:hypothetical protein